MSTSNELSDTNSSESINETNFINSSELRASDSVNSVGIEMFENFDVSSVVFSPFGVVTILSLVQIASTGDSGKQLLKLLKINLSVDQIMSMYQLYISNAMKIVNVLIFNKTNKINRKYINMIKGTTLIALENFGKTSLANQKINHYIEEKTDGLIKNIVSQQDINDSMSIILASAIYFKASWQHKFNPGETTLVKFHATNNVHIMHQINYFNYYENKKIQLIELPYDEKDYVMGIILPVNYMEETNLEYSLSNVPYLPINEINEYINNLKLTKIDLYLPKFTHHKKIDLIPVLKKIGIYDLFDDKRADLNLISKKAFVSKIIHETVVVVDELGTELADKKIINPDNSKIFKADHAFIYYIRYSLDNTFLIFGDYQGN